MTTPDQPEPGQLAGFDQTHAAIGTNLDDLGAMYAEQLAEGHNAGLTMAGLAVWLLNASNLDASGLADHLAVSVQRLHDARREHQAAYECGVAEGRRQATEGWRRDWGVVMEPDWYADPADVASHWPTDCDDEEDARRLIHRGSGRGRTLVSRLVGPWEPAPTINAELTVAAEQDGADR